MQQALISVLPIGRRESRRFKQRLTTIRSSVQQKNVQAQLWFRGKTQADKILHDSASN